MSKSTLMWIGSPLCGQIHFILSENTKIRIYSIKILLIRSKANTHVFTVLVVCLILFCSLSFCSLSACLPRAVLRFSQTFAVFFFFFSFIVKVYLM